MGLIIVNILKTFWRWSQLYLTLLILIIERITRFFVTTVFGFVPFKFYFDNIGFSSGVSKEASEEEKDLERDAIEMITARGYPVEEHFVTTPDGFILGLHRITGPKQFNTPPDSPPTSPRKIFSKKYNNNNNSVKNRQSQQQQQQEQSKSVEVDSESVSTTSSTTPSQLFSSNKPVVVIMHGFMQTSEAWLCRSDPKDSLPFILADAGFDVWLGNNRGNKYSFKHTQYTPNQEGFWNWSLDELVRYDFPSIVNFICDRTGAKSISYIGFSQGTAQGWAALSTNTAVAKKINLFIALAPVSTVKGFSNPMIDSLARSRPDFIFLLFGKKSMLPSTIFWRNFLPKDIFVKVIDTSVRFLFGWHTENISQDEKAMLYSHIFSYTSVKSVVHWFQIIQTNRFQMFDDILLGITPNENSKKPHRYHGRVIPGYHPAQILTKCALFYGGSDSLPNTKALLDHLPRDKVVMVHEEEKYEHLDFMWGKDSKKVFSKIVSLLKSNQNDILLSPNLSPKSLI
ncbi:hypothetical protein DICPUDRAFT_92027 [Dictyostelium purpureum]|uniref:Partial AB-hydrolase lipase domain-containing protein n=1 Tax=Dictyostelium purpureum TaxID=5786 RepID=F0ZKS4_DICPU|nr:uncharacterized protein DICPUDRAFT_92027 [Dictyostelium purpureum]EGC35478.1 hypothetical protein DICPUDRAFT_92027 [Dictyostelium purpureum]|eukprot:XP_003288021.1 hypothetical protein DICPUDRAFT_92027 [Dictyostelium purpureum]